MKRSIQLAAACAAIAIAAAGQVQAGVILDFTESSGDTIITVSGSFDLTGLTIDSPNSVWPTHSNGGGSGYYSEVAVGSLGTPTYFDSHGGTANFDLFTTDFSSVRTTDFTGHAFGIWNIFGTAIGYVQIDQNYVSGTALYGRGTLEGLTFTDLGLVNSGLWLTIKNGETVTVTLNRAGASAVPEPTSLAIFGIAAVGLIARGNHRRKKQQA